MGDRKEDRNVDLFGSHEREFPRRPWAGAALLVGRLNDELAEAGIDVGEDAWWGGSYRRVAETVGDLDLVVLVDVVDMLPAILARPKPTLKQWSVDVDALDGTWVQVDVWTCAQDEVGPMLVFVTGPGRLNVAMRARGRIGVKVNQWGCWRGHERIDRGSEESVFDAVGLAYRTPEERERYR